MRYHTVAGGQEEVVELTAEGVRLAGRTEAAELASLPGGRGRHHLRIGDRGYRIHAARSDDGWVVRIGGRTVRVRVEDERTRRIREMAGQDLGAGGGGEVRAPMPGRIVRILVDVGQEVEPGTPLLTIEAMKMENELRAERGGIVARIEVEEGETVNQDAVLAVVEEPAAEED